MGEFGWVWRFQNGPIGLRPLLFMRKTPSPPPTITNNHHHFHLTILGGGGSNEEERDLLQFQHDLQQAENVRVCGLQMEDLPRRISELERFSLQQSDPWRLRAFYAPPPSFARSSELMLGFRFSASGGETSLVGSAIQSYGAGASINGTGTLSYNWAGMGWTDGLGWI
ncbi:hypothetical protein EAF04_003135 [Stromatinia cepivora]|nr:hypothetical protein EAF04_003135 [Stromatinia cepivora]